MKVLNVSKHQYQSSEDTLETEGSILLGNSLTYKNCFLRLLSFLCDLIFMLWPFILFVVALVCMISPLKIGREFIYNPVYIHILIVCSIFLCNTLSTIYNIGQTIGHRMYHLKVVNYNGQEVGLLKAFIRELFGKSIPLVFLFTYYKTFGILIYMFINGIVVFLDPKHRSIIDFILHTKIVLLQYEDVKSCSTLSPSSLPMLRKDYGVWNTCDSQEKTRGRRQISRIYKRPLQFIKDTMSNSKKALKSYIQVVCKQKKISYSRKNKYQEVLEEKVIHKRQSFCKYHRKKRIRKHYKRRKKRNI